MTIPNSNITAEELRIICDTIVRLTDLQQQKCPQLIIEKLAPELLSNLLTELHFYKQGLIRIPPNSEI